MHPFFADRRWLALYLLLFVQAGLGLVEILVRTFGEPRSVLWPLILPLFIAHAFNALGSWYTCRALPPSRERAGFILLSQLLSIVAAGSLPVVLGFGWAEILGGQAPAVYRRSTTLTWIFCLFLASLMVVLHYFFLALEASKRSQAQALEAQILAREAELQSLRSQLDPHFLFNSLSSVSALVGSDPELARKMCSRLADFFRRTLELGAKTWVPLSAEIALVEGYLAIEQTRFGSRLRSQVELPSELRNIRVPPLILQPLAENAIRHGIGHLLEGGLVRVEARRSGGAESRAVGDSKHGDSEHSLEEDPEGNSLQILLIVENPCDPDRPASRGTGVGLANVRERLKTLYAGKARFRTRGNDESFSVQIRLPAQELKDPSAEKEPQ